MLAGAGVRGGAVYGRTDKDAAYADEKPSKPEDLAGIFFASFSKEHPGTFPSAVEVAAEDGKTEKKIEPVKEGLIVAVAVQDGKLGRVEKAIGPHAADRQEVSNGLRAPADVGFERRSPRPETSVRASWPPSPPSFRARSCA